jgi:hypothetical protein
MDGRIAQLLQTTPIFRKLSAEDRARLVPHARVRDYARGCNLRYQSIVAGAAPR